MHRHLVILYFDESCRLCWLYFIFDNTISCLNVTYLFLGFAHSVSGLRHEHLSMRFNNPNYLNKEVKSDLAFGLAKIGLATSSRFFDLEFVSNIFPVGFALLGLSFFYWLQGCQQFLYSCITMLSFCQRETECCGIKVIMSSG